jgi:exopolyphosphatase/guanosine-5'-triphosphate,3'-diphosphate pyrophosphatase
MAEITPRWEWRTFGTTFGVADERIDKLEASPVHVSEEVYYLAPGGDIVKVRDGLLDIKTLQAVHSDGGLEQWIPVLKAEFPLTGEVLAAACAALRRPPPDGPIAVANVEELTAALATADSGVLAVPITKRRYRYTIGGCIAERSEVEVGGRKRRTIAIEDPDPDKVIAAVRDLGLGAYLNTNYAAGLPAILTDQPERYAVVDVGTNSVKLHVGERQDDGKWRRVVDRAVITRLGEGLEPGGAIGDEPLERTAGVVAKMVDEARQAGALAVAAVTTAGPRMASNGDAVVAEIGSRAGVPLELLSGDEESRLAYVGATAGIAQTGVVVVFDTGGGSSQFSFGTDGRVADRFSLNVGAVRYTEQFGLAGAVSEETVAEARAAIAADLESLAGRDRPDALIGMGGALTNMTAVSLSMATYDPDRVHGARLTRDEVDRQIALYRSTDANGRRTIVGLQPDRAEVILAGACIVRTVMDHLGCDVLTVSDRGLRHGVLLERFGSANQRRRPMNTGAQPKPRRASSAKATKATQPVAAKSEVTTVAAAATDAASTPTTTGADAAPRLSDADLGKLLDLIKGVDSVELKLTVPTEVQRATIQGLPLDPVEAQPRQVFFFDTPGLDLFNAGVVVRARRIQGGGGDTVVKLRPVVPDQLPEALRNDAAFKTEVDVVPGGFVCSGSFKGKTTGQAIRDAIAGKTPLRKLFSKAQRAFYAEHAPEGVALNDLVPLGPTFILKATFTPKELKRRVTAEVWLYPDGSRILELSTKATPAEAFQVSAEARAYLSKVGVTLGGAQEPKTRSALEFYAGQLSAT